MADVRMQMVVAVVRNEKWDVEKDIHGYEQKYLFYDDILQIMLTFFSFHVHAPWLFDFVALQIKRESLFLHPLNVWVGLISNNRGWRKLKCASLDLISRSHIACVLIPLKCATCVNKSGLTSVWRLTPGRSQCFRSIVSNHRLYDSLAWHSLAPFKYVASLIEFS